MTGLIPLEQPVDQAGAAVRAGVSMEVLVWAALVAGAAMVRLMGLAETPLSVVETSRSLDATLVARGDTVGGWPGDLVAALTSYLFRIFGEGEVVVRIVPALSGTVLIAVLWWARPYAGRAGALLAALLTGFSPLFVLASRSATPYSAGTLLAGLMVVSLSAYVREPRPVPLSVFVACAVLAPLTDAVATTALLAVIVYVAVEAGVLGNRDMGRAWNAFRRSPAQMASAAIIVLAGLQLGLTHFGTSLDRTGLPGLRLWSEMFETPRDNRAPEYHLALLLAYDWPLFVAGSAGFWVLAARLRRGAFALNTAQRFLIIWTLTAAISLAFTTRRDAGELLILLLPLALVAGNFLGEWAAGLEWRPLIRWWPLTVAALGLAAYAVMLMTQWSATTAGPAERFAMTVAAGGVLFLMAAPFVHLGRNAAVIPLVTVGTLAIVFMGHSSLAAAFGHGTEFAVDERLTMRTEHLRKTLDQLAEERGGEIVVDPNLRDALGWTLKDSHAAFGEPRDRASVIVALAGDTPEGYVPLGGTWRIAEGWYPDALLRPRSMWRWLLYRESYWRVETVDVRIYVPTV